MLSSLLLLLSATAIAHSTNLTSSDLGCGSKLRSAILQRIFQNYNKHVRPPPGDTATDIWCNAAIYSISEVNEAKYYWVVSMFFGTQWDDTRLAYQDMVANCPDFNYIMLTTEEMVAKLWKPNLHFPNAISDFTHKTLQPNVGLRIYPDGHHEIKGDHVSVKLYCPGDDSSPGEFKCPVELYPYGVESSELNVVWSQADAVTLWNPISIPNYTLGTITAQNITRTSSTGSYTVIRADFSFIKNMIKPSVFP